MKEQAKKGFAPSLQWHRKNRLYLLQPGDTCKEPENTDREWISGEGDTAGGFISGDEVCGDGCFFPKFNVKHHIEVELKMGELD